MPLPCGDAVSEILYRLRELSANLFVLCGNFRCHIGLELRELLCQCVIRQGDHLCCEDGGVVCAVDRNGCHRNTLGICTMESRLSMPPITLVAIGTPITGSVV